MKRLIVDFLKRRKWYVLGIGAYFIFMYAQFLVTEDGRRSPPRSLNIMFLGVVVSGVAIMVGDMQMGVSRIAGTLPLSVRMDGVFIQEHDGERWRVLMDMEGEALGRLKAQGATEISAAPVTLEDLFVGIVTGEK